MKQINYKIFMSSTFSDLRSERIAVEEVIDRMSLTYVGMEHFGSFSDEPLNKCLAMVRLSDLVILVVGSYYGSIPRGKVISFTEAEYREASNQNKPVLVYLKATTEEMEQQNPQLINLINHLKETKGVSYFDTPRDLAWKVASDLYRELPDVSISDFPRVVNKVNDLIELFDYRFGLVEKELSKHYEYVQVEAYLNEFKALHLKHKEFLLAENLILAHEVLCDIHSLSASLERDEFWKRHRIKTPNVKYRLRPDAFLNGPMYKIYSKEYVNAHKGGLFLTRSEMAVREQKQGAEDLYFSISNSI